MPTLAPQSVNRHIIDNWLVVSSTSQALDPTSTIRLASLANSCKLHEIFIWIMLSECYDTWVERWTTKFSISWQHQFDLKDIRMLIGHAKELTDDRPQDSSSLSEVEPSPRVGRIADRHNFEHKGRIQGRNCGCTWCHLAEENIEGSGIPMKDLIPLYYDNMSNIHLARNPVFHARTKHIEVH